MSMKTQPRCLMCDTFKFKAQEVIGKTVIGQLVPMCKPSKRRNEPC